MDLAPSNVTEAVKSFEADRITRVTRSKSKSPSPHFSSAHSSAAVTNSGRLESGDADPDVMTGVLESNALSGDGLLGDMDIDLFATSLSDASDNRRLSTSRSRRISPPRRTSTRRHGTHHSSQEEVTITIHQECDTASSDVGDQSINATKAQELVDLTERSKNASFAAKEATETDSDLSSISSKVSDTEGEHGVRIVKYDPRKRRLPAVEIPQTRSKRARLVDEAESSLIMLPEPKRGKKRQPFKRPATPTSHELDTEDDGRAVTLAISKPAEVPERRPPGRPRKDGKPRSDPLSGPPHSIVLGGVRLPNNMIKNPLPARQPAIPPEPSQELLEDMKQMLAMPMDMAADINGEGASMNSDISAAERLASAARKAEMDMKRTMYRRQIKVPKPISIQTQDMRSFLANLAPPSPTKFSQDMEGLKATGDSDNHCSACLLGGYLVCCESCPRVFHVGCMDPPLSKVPDGMWECARCRPRQEAFPELLDTLTGNSLWRPLFNSLNRTNTRVFELPRTIREMFEGVLTHPHSGAYLDATEREIMEEDGRMRRKDKRQRMLGVGDSSMKEGGSRDGTTKGIRREAEPEVHVCYRCAKTDMKLPSTQFLSSRAELFSHISHRSGDTLLVNDCVRSNMIKCDFCSLHWHYDCLDPPLADAPPRNLEKIDLNLIRDLRKTSWGTAGVHDWEWNDYTDVGRPKRRGLDDATAIAEFGDERFNRASPTSNFNLGMVFIRRRWMCPCHADWLKPKRRKKKTWGWIEVEEGIEAPPMLTPTSIVDGDVKVDNVFTITSRNPDPTADYSDLVPPAGERRKRSHAVSFGGVTSSDANPASNGEVENVGDNTSSTRLAAVPDGNSGRPDATPPVISVMVDLGSDDVGGPGTKPADGMKVKMDRLSSATTDALSDVETLSDVQTSDDESKIISKPVEPVEPIVPVVPVKRKRGRPPKNRDAAALPGVSRPNGLSIKLKLSPGRIDREVHVRPAISNIHREVLRRTIDSRNDGDIEVREPDVEDWQSHNTSGTAAAPPPPTLLPPRPVPKPSPLAGIKDSLMLPKELKIKIEREVDVDGLKHRIPAKRLKLDFIDKCRSLRSLVIDTKETGGSTNIKVAEDEARAVERVAPSIPPVGESWSAVKVEELYTASKEDLMVDSAVSYLAASSYECDTGRSGSHDIATADDVDVWLDFISGFEMDVAYHLQRRRAAQGLL
ncbi:hypothetical protein SeLEV6574_g05374 [Synchytrium endobioticum]|nr:hypothetical protein SeLEV6574_g05374 [Synchytrium endobioticum]